MTETHTSPDDFKQMLFVDDPFDSIELEGVDGEGLETDVQRGGQTRHLQAGDQAL